MESNQTELQSLLNEYLSKNPGGEEQLARLFDVSRPTITRWAKGKTSPSRVVLKRVIPRLKSLLQKQRLFVIGDIMDFLKELSGSYPEITGYSVGLNGDIKMVYRKTLSRKREKEIGELIMKRCCCCMLIFMEEKVYQRHLGKKLCKQLGLDVDIA